LTARKQNEAFTQKTSLMDGALAAAPGHVLNVKASQTVRIKLW